MDADALYQLFLKEQRHEAKTRTIKVTASTEEMTQAFKKMQREVMYLNHVIAGLNDPKSAVVIGGSCA